MSLLPPDERRPLVFKRPLIIGFFQMNWFNIRQGEELKKLHLFYQDPDAWRDMLIHTQAGKVLKSVFEDLYDRIVWRMPNPGPRKIERSLYAAFAGIDTSAADFDAGYLLHLLAQVRPEIVFGLGNSAQEGLGKVICQVPHVGSCLFSKHPMEVGAVDSLKILLTEIHHELAEIEK